MQKFALIFLLAALAIRSFADTAIAPARIASLNLCVDELLVTLVEPERINSLTYLSANSQFSPFAARAKQFHLNRGLAEDLVPRNPDLILAGDFGALDAKILLKQLGFRVETLSLPQTLNDITAHIRKFGELTASQVAAEKMAVKIEEKIAKLDSMNNQNAINAFWYASNGVVVGANTLENELMTRAGFHNLALDKYINGFAHLDLEELLLAKPQAIIIEESDVHAYSIAKEYVYHPALKNSGVKIISLPANLSVCIAPIAADVIENLIQQKQLWKNN